MRLFLVLISLTCSRAVLAAVPPAPTADALTARWLEIRKAFTRYSWQKPQAVIRPKLHPLEAKQLRRIARMDHVSVDPFFKTITGTNEAYWKGAREGTPRPGARRLSIQLDGDGKPRTCTQRGGVAKHRAVWDDQGTIVEYVQFRAGDRGEFSVYPSTHLLGIQQHGPAERLKQMGVYDKAKVTLRRFGKGKDATSIGVAPAGRIDEGLLTGDGAFTMMPRRTLKPRIAPGARP